MAYQAAEVVAEGLRRDPTRQGVRGAVLALGTFRGLRGDLAIDRFGDVHWPPLVMTIRGCQVVRAE
jgi:hypothetical protein